MTEETETNEADLYAILYRSRAAAVLSDNDVALLALASARWNAKAGVTGVLLWADVKPGRPELFVQWLEGERGAVRALYERIRRDDRHTDVEVIAEGTAADVVGRDGRLFPDWGMRFERVGAAPVTLDAFLADWLANRPEARNA